MRHLLSLLAFLFATIWTGGAAVASCDDAPDVFDTLPAATQAELRAKAAKAPFSEGILWQVEKAGVTSTIVGTLHIADPQHERTLDKIAALNTQVDQVLLELDSAANLAFQQHLTDNPALYLIEDGPSLIDRLGEENWALVAKDLNDRGIPPFMAARYQPWFLGMMLMLPACAFESVKAGEKGLDHLIEAYAQANALPTGSLDDTESLLDILAGDPLDVQVTEMIWALELGLQDDAATQMPTLTAFYRSEDIQLIWEFGEHMTLSRAQDDATAAELAGLITQIESDLVVRRNRQWADRLIPTLAETPSLVAVGALHLPGENGLLALLADAGFTVTRVPLAQ